METYRWRLHAFVLLTNHDHLFVETPEANLSARMHHYNGSYAGYFNAGTAAPDTSSRDASRDT